MVTMDKPSVREEFLARDVSFDEYMEKYAESFAEWVYGDVVKMPPVTDVHDDLFQFLLLLLRHYLDETNIGLLRAAPFVMKTAPHLPGREPDLQIILNEHDAIVKPTKIDGAADVVIEIVSKESTSRDRGDKFAEYQEGGVREYWLIDPLRKGPLFYQLDAAHVLVPIALHDGVFRSIVLPQFRLDTRLLWQAPLPNARQILVLVETLLKEGA